MLDVAAKLREVEEKTRLALTTLDEAVRVQQLLDDASLAGSLALVVAVAGVEVVVHHVVAAVVAVADRQAVHQAQG